MKKIDFSIGKKIRKREKLKNNLRYYNLKGQFTKSEKIDFSIG